MSRLFKKTLGFIVLLFVLISVGVSLLTGWQIFRGMSYEFETKGESIASIVADASALPMLHSNPIELQSMIDEYLDIVGISYILVVDEDREIVAHTLVPGIPDAVKLVIEQIPEGLGKATSYHERNHRFAPASAVVAPILGGSAGFVVVGLDSSIIKREIWSFVLRQQLAIVALLLASIVACYIFIQRISGPLVDLARHARSIASIDLGQLTQIEHESQAIAVQSRDEIGELAESFNYMEQHLSKSVSQLAESVAKQERMETELSVAREIQALILPDLSHFSCPGDRVSVFSEITPAREVGGDFVDCFTVPGQRPGQNYLFFAVGDVSGKGVPAALFMSMACTLIRSRAPNMQSPRALMEYVNRYLSSNNEACMFVTVFCGLLELGSGEMRYCSAGHMPPLLHREKEGVSHLARTQGVALGADEDARYEEGTVCIESGSTLFLYTDGITEATNPAQQFYGDQRLASSIEHSGGATVKSMANQVSEDLAMFVDGAEQSDDITLLLVRYD